MSRSFKRTPITGNTTARSEKQDKQACNRMMRRNTRKLLHVGEEDWFPDEDYYMTMWEFSKDGKHWFGFMLTERRKRGIPNNWLWFDLHRNGSVEKTRLAALGMLRK